MPLFIRRPVTIEAHVLTRENIVEVREWIWKHKGQSKIEFEAFATCDGLTITNANNPAQVRATFGDWIIHHTNGNFISCTNDLFTLLYQPIEETITT